MTTQVSFTANEDLKNRALKKAKEQGITLKAFLIFAMKGFVDGKLVLNLENNDDEPDVEELFFEDPDLLEKSKKLAALLKKI